MRNTLSSALWLRSSVAPELHSISLLPRRSLPRPSQPLLRSSFSPRVGRRSFRFPTPQSLSLRIPHATLHYRFCAAALFCLGSPSPCKKLPPHRRPSGRSAGSAEPEAPVSRLHSVNRCKNRALALRSASIVTPGPSCLRFHRPSQGPLFWLSQTPPPPPAWSIQPLPRSASRVCSPSHCPA
jgi:hypothetical protein